MPKVVNTKEYLDIVCELLLQGQSHVPVPVAGNSMVPFLHNGDTVYLELPRTPLKKADIVLYTRPDGRYILHRIVRVNSDGSFIMMGDAQQEKEWIQSAGQIHGRVVSVVHRGKRIGPESRHWKFYATVWLWAIPLRRWLMASVPKIKKKNR
ncbi:MAG: S24/S26 family peptidase [Oscillospiraceae bacterium]|nr:S24/S26 family peptidase [Oscillospiraceae bacterium]